MVSVAHGDGAVPPRARLATPHGNVAVHRRDFVDALHKQLGLEMPVRREHGGKRVRARLMGVRRARKRNPEPLLQARA